MPLFSRSSFRTPRKPVRRKGGSMPNISQLDDTAFSVDSLRLDGAPVTMKLGGHEFTFEDGQWVVGGFLRYTIWLLLAAFTSTPPYTFARGISGAGWAQRTGTATETISENSGGEQPT